MLGAVYLGRGLLAEHLEAAVRLAGDLLDGRVVQPGQRRVLVVPRAGGLGVGRHRGDQHVVSAATAERGGERRTCRGT